MNIQHTSNNRFLIANTGTSYSLRIVDLGARTLLAGVGTTIFTVGDLGFDPRDAFMIQILANQPTFSAPWGAYNLEIPGNMQFTDFRVSDVDGSITLRVKDSTSTPPGGDLTIPGFTVAAMTPY